MGDAVTTAIIEGVSEDPERVVEIFAHTSYLEGQTIYMVMKMI